MLMWDGTTAGNFPERLCQPMADYITSRGGEIHLNKRIREIVTNDDGSVSHYALTDGTKQEADLYVSAMSGELVTFDCRMQLRYQI